MQDKNIYVLSYTPFSRSIYYFMDSATVTRCAFANDAQSEENNEFVSSAVCEGTV